MTNYPPPEYRPPPAYVYPQTPYQSPTNRHEGLAVASLCLGVVGCLFGLIPLTFWIALICGALALIFGFIGHRPKKAKWGIALGTVAIILGIIGVVIINNAVNKLNTDLNSIPTALSAQTHPGWQHNPHNPHYVPLTRPSSTATCTGVQTGTIGSQPHCV
jgi:hypothetical protein